MRKRENRMHEIEPFVKWVGGKRQLLPVIEKHLPASIKDYYEPFVGGGALFLHLKSKHAHINDINRSLMNAYKAICEDHENVLRCLDDMDNTLRQEGKACYYSIRDAYNQRAMEGHYDTFLAAAFIFLNKHGFNGLFRVNRQGSFNVPYNYSTRPSYNRENIEGLARLLQQTQPQITNLDFATSVKDAKEGDFIFFDSPYAPLTETSFVGYTKNGFGKEEHIRLADLFKKLTDQGALCMLTNHNTPFVRDLYGGFHQEVVPARRSINRDGRHRMGEELLITNYES